MVEFWDEFAKLELFEVKVESLEHSFKIIYIDESVSVIVEVFDSFLAEVDIFFRENILHSSTIISKYIIF